MAFEQSLCLQSDVSNSNSRGQKWELISILVGAMFYVSPTLTMLMLAVVPPVSLGAVWPIQISDAHILMIQKYRFSMVVIWKSFQTKPRKRWAKWQRCVLWKMKFVTTRCSWKFFLLGCFGIPLCTPHGSVLQCRPPRGEKVPRESRNSSSPCKERSDREWNFLW